MTEPAAPPPAEDAKKDAGPSEAAGPEGEKGPSKNALKKAQKEKEKVEKFPRAPPPAFRSITCCPLPFAASNLYASI